MNGATTIQIVLLVLVLIAWGWVLFSTLSRLRARGSLGSEIGRWFRSPEDRKDRNTFLFLTFVLAAMVLMQVALPAA